MVRHREVLAREVQWCLILHLVPHNKTHGELLTGILANAPSFWFIQWNSLKSKSRCPVASAAAGSHSLIWVWGVIYKRAWKNQELTFHWDGQGVGHPASPCTPVAKYNPHAFWKRLLSIRHRLLK